MKVKRCWLLAVAIIIGGTIVCWAYRADDRDSLVGVEGMTVLVEPFDSEAKAAGLEEILFQNDVDLKLRLAGIKVLSWEEAAATPGVPILFIKIGVLKENIKRSPYAVATHVAFCQDVYLKRNPSITCESAVTWSQAGVLLVSKEVLKSCLREQIKGLTDMFINDYLEANPKEPAKTLEELTEEKEPKPDQKQ